jgi:iron-sulfur cluster assembly protein
VLTLTDNAVMAIRDLAAQQGAPESGGLRITTDPGDESLTLTMAKQPAQGDQVVDNEGARVFLDPDAARMLDDQSLDAGFDPQGGVQFGFTERPS